MVCNNSYWWKNFEKVLAKAKIACKNTGISVAEHFLDARKTIKMPKGAEKEYTILTEDEKRFYQRNLTKKGNYSLNQTAKKAGGKKIDEFHNSGYKGLYKENNDVRNFIYFSKKLDFYGKICYHIKVRK